MHTLIEADSFRSLPPPVVLAAGFFDGVHTGHRRVLDAAIGQARAAGGQAWALTFDQHPLAILDPERRPPMLTTIGHRLDLLAATGLDGCLMLPFTTQLAALPPEAFLARITDGPGRPVGAVCCGDNWRFGNHAAGSPAWLRTHGGIAATVVPPVFYEGAPVSSTRIREAIRRGDLDAARGMLGRRVSLLGTVVRGAGIGRTLGFPTANLDLHHEVRPPEGVYATLAVIGGRVYPSATNIGRPPTLRPGGPAYRSQTATVETHVLDFAGDLYGQDIEVRFVERLRDEESFATASPLAERIGRDVVEARRRLAALKEAPETP